MGSHTVAIKDVNVFFWIFIVLLLILLARLYLLPYLLVSQRKVAILFRVSVLRFLLRPQLIKLLMVATGALFITATIFELYYVQGSCSVNPKYYDTNKATAIKVINFLSDREVSFWPDGASLLNVLRKEEINAWDHDVDFSMVHPGEVALKELIASLSADPSLSVQYLASRCVPCHSLGRFR